MVCTGGQTCHRISASPRPSHWTGATEEGLFLGGVADGLVGKDGLTLFRPSIKHLIHGHWRNVFLHVRLPCMGRRMKRKGGAGERGSQSWKEEEKVMIQEPVSVHSSSS